MEYTLEDIRKVLSQETIGLRLQRVLNMATIIEEKYTEYTVRVYNTLNFAFAADVKNINNVYLIMSSKTGIPRYNDEVNTITDELKSMYKEVTQTEASTIVPEYDETEQYIKKVSISA